MFTRDLRVNMTKSKAKGKPSKTVKKVEKRVEKKVRSEEKQLVRAVLPKSYVGSKGVPMHSRFKGYKRHGRAMSRGSECTKDAKLYADSLIAPELHLPAKLPDDNMIPTIVAHSEFEVTVLPITDADSKYDWYGVAFVKTTKGQYTTLSAVSSAATDNAFTWAAASDHPQQTTFASDFPNGRLVSSAVHVFDTTSMLAKAGEWFTARIMGGEGFVGGTGSLPTTFKLFSNTPACESFVNSADCHGARTTYFPQREIVDSFVAIGSADASGVTQVIIFRAPHTYSGPLQVRFYGNHEFTIYQDTMSLFEPSTDIGKPGAVADAIMSAAKWMMEAGTTVNAFEQIANTAGFGNLIAGMRKGWELGRYLWAGSNGTLGNNRQRSIALLDRAVSAAKQSDLPRDTVARFQELLAHVWIVEHSGMDTLSSEFDRLPEVRGPIPKPR